MHDTPDMLAPTMPPDRPPAVTVRIAGPDDAHALAPLLTQLGYPTPPDTLASRLAGFTHGGDECVVAEQGGRIVGFLTTHVTPVLHRPTPVGRITALVVSDEVRGTGIGRVLVEAAVARLAARGCALVEVTSNLTREGAHRFYERIGFDRTSYRFKIDTVPGGGSRP